MQITQKDHGDAKLLQVSGRVDSDACNELEARCERCCLAGAKTLVMDMSAVDYLSSAGLRALLSGAKLMEAGEGKLVLVMPEGPALEIVKMAGFDKVLTICGSMQEASKYLKGTFQVHLTKNWDVDVMTVYGRVDADKAPELEAAGRKVMEAGHLKLVVSLAAVDYLSSAGLSALLGLTKCAQEKQCRLFLCSPSGPVKQILELSGFDKVLPIRDSVDAALVE